MTITTATSSPSSSTTTTTTTTIATNSTTNPNPNLNPNSSSTTPMQSWWESLSRARSRVLSLSPLLPSLPSETLTLIADSDRPAHSLLSSPSALLHLSLRLSAPLSGSGDDPLCCWLYDTFLSPDPDLRLVVLSLLPLISHLYLSRVIGDAAASPNLAGFEAVLLAVYSLETKLRGGKPQLVSLPDLSQPSIYHSPRPQRNSSPRPHLPPPVVGLLSPPLEPQLAVKSTKRACIVAVALDNYYKKISLMPAQTKVEFCNFVVSWAGQDCKCRYEFDDDVKIEICGEDLEEVGRRGNRIPLPWELLQPVLRILGHCLLAPGNGEEVRDVASAAVRTVYARAMHELLPQAILAARSLIRLDIGARKAVKLNGEVVGSNPTTPSKSKRPEGLLMSN